MPRVTAPVAKLSRSLNSISPITNNTAALAPQYAELLRTRSGDHADARRSSTIHRPTPQPDISGRVRPLMQPFHSSSSAASAAAVTSAHLDAMVLPSMFAVESSAAPSESNSRVPLLPDNYTARHGPDAADAPLMTPEISIVAAHPGNVLAPLTEVEGIGLDGVELGFVHEHPADAGRGGQANGGMVKDIWHGMMDDMFGGPKKSKS